MITQELAGSKDDEYFTPSYAILPLLKYLKPKSDIWCPFDTEKSQFVKTLCRAGHNVFYTHLERGEDFFQIEMKPDYIISNPPFSLKNEVFSRLFSLGIPFAMLVGFAGIFESQTRFKLFSKNNFEIMILNLRVSYFKSYETEKLCDSVNPPYQSVYICSNILPKQIVFETINKQHKNSQTTLTQESQS